MSYIGTEPKDIRSFGRTKFDYTATQGQTAFTGADDDGKVLAFTTGQIEVYVNGILMDDSDFTTTGTGTVTLASAANLNDVVNVVSFETNIPDSNYVPASGGTFTGYTIANAGFRANATSFPPLIIDRKTTTGYAMYIAQDGSVKGIIGTTDDSDVVIGKSTTTLKYASYNITPAYGSGADRNGIVSLGSDTAKFKDFYLDDDAYIGGGIYLGGTAAANKLEDYEEGNWTPTFTASGYTFTYVASTEGRYVKVGKLVHLNGYMRATPSGSGTTQLTITGLPFSISNVNNSSYTAGSIIVETSGSLFSGIPQLRPNRGGTTIPIFQVRAGQSPLPSSVNVANLTSTMEFEFQVTYHTA